MDLEQRLGYLKSELCKSAFRSGKGGANEVNYWIFDYPPEQEQELRAYLQRQQERQIDYTLTVYDIYDLTIDHLERKGFLDQCFTMEQEKGLERVAEAISRTLKLNETDCLLVRHIEEHTPENAVVFLTGIGKCYPLIRAHKILNLLHQGFHRAPVVLFYPGVYDERSLQLFGRIDDENYYRAFRIVP